MSSDSTNKQRVAIITGAGKQSGLGYATARALSAAGVAVVLNDVAPRGLPNKGEQPSDAGDASWRGLETAVESIKQEGGSASMVLGDVSSEAGTQEIVQHALDNYGRVDILVNFAGSPKGPESVDIEELSLEAWESVMAVHVRGTFLMSRAAVGPMRKQGWGRIINLSSETAVKGAIRRCAYAAAKAAVIGFTRALAFDVADWGITVNALCPGWIATSRVTSVARDSTGADATGVLDKHAQSLLIRRLGRPDEIASMIGFLASDAAAYITGQSILIDGGGQRAAV
jgi:3-oxoacyl-[acyl-carrier protein] reductase